jgi:tetratricopeptide (TPR) repeat protein
MLRSRPVLVVWPVLLLLGAVAAAGCGKSAAQRAEAAKTAQKYVEMGEDCLAEGNRKKAMAAYSKAIEVDPRCQTAYVRRGLMYKEARQHEQAMADFTEAIDIDPTDSYPYELRRDLYRNVYHDEAKAEADDKAAALIRQGRWDELPKLRKK